LYAVAIANSKTAKIVKRLEEEVNVNHKGVPTMSFFLKVNEPGKASGQLKSSYEMLLSMFPTVPKVFVAQSMRPDLLEPIVTYVNRLMIETHALCPGVLKSLLPLTCPS
jgi:hypothetical protein